MVKTKTFSLSDDVSVRHAFDLAFEAFVALRIFANIL